VVQEVQPPSIEVAAKTLLDMLVPEQRAGWEMFSPLLRAYTRQWVEALFEVAGEPHPMVTMQSFMMRQSLLRAWGQFQQTHPLIVAPIGSSVPFEIGKDRTTPEVAATVRGMRMALAVNALGLPAVALPVGVAEGLPQAVQVIGPRYREDLCLDAAAALEDRVGILTPIDPR
jgi:amidase